jgi:abortive infection bacteriophage resistance protein
MKQLISAYYNISDEILFSWLMALNGVRNICAHHGRLIYRELGYQPKIPREQKYPDWHMPVKITREKIFGILTILRYLLRFDAPTSNWEERLRKLLSDHPDVPKRSMDFPENWEDSPLWKNK